MPDPRISDYREVHGLREWVTGFVTADFGPIEISGHMTKPSNLAAATSSAPFQKELHAFCQVDSLPNVRERLGDLLDIYFLQTEAHTERRTDYYADIRGLQKLLAVLDTELDVVEVRKGKS